jgi:hypothetical protein
MRCTIEGNVMKASERIWWVKLVGALILAVISYFIQVYLHVDGTLIFSFGTVIFLTLSQVMSNMYQIDRNRCLKIGIGTFFFTWMSVWVLLYSLSLTMI